MAVKVNRDLQEFTMKQQFIDVNFQAKTLELIEHCNRILEEVEAAGEEFNLRQLYYRLVTENLIVNSVKSYKRLSSITTDARMAGFMDWNHLEDRHRTAYGFYPSESVEDIIATIDDAYEADRWEDQDYYVEAWIEKDALIRVLQNAANPWYCTYMSCKGNISTTEIYNASLRFQRRMRAGKKCVLLHTADHDPSGLDMTRDISDRLLRLEADVEVKRIALNYDQIQEREIPPNPVKESDSKSPSYIDQFGHDSWELDAIPPRELTRLIEDAITDHIDMDIWDRVAEEEIQAKEQLTWIANNHEEVLEFVDERMHYDD